MRKACVGLALLLAGCGKAFLPPPPSFGVPEPAADSVESVVFLIGDAGDATFETAPILHRLRSEIEQWSQNMRDSTVVVLYLGDNVYPKGVRDETDPAFPQDSARLQGQLEVVSGEQARRHGTRAIFIAGNHDWGHM